MEEFKKLEKRIEKLEKMYDKKDFEWDWSNPNQSFEQYQNFLKPESTELYRLRRRLRFIMPYELSELPDYGDVMKLKDFIECCKEGLFINYDGYGRYVKDGKETNVEIYPSDVKNDCIRYEFDTIIWYNR